MWLKSLLTSKKTLLPFYTWYFQMPLQWHHNGHNSVSNHHPRTIVYSTIYSEADQRKHQSSASLAFVRGIRQWLVNSPHKWPVTRKMFSFDDVIMHFTRPWNKLSHVYAGPRLGHHCACRFTSTVLVPGHQQAQCWIQRNVSLQSYSGNYAS